MNDDSRQPGRAFEERIEALLRERYGTAFKGLSPEEVRALRARVGLRPEMTAIDEERALAELARELAALKKKH